jgi:2-polyprenyl-3-methyl-5-hydroxy-6-metoxy-1,4-benzoquinol methylase
MQMATMMEQAQPNPALIFETLNGYQRTGALKAAIQLDLFTAVGEGNETPDRLAKRCGITERAARILCDYFSIVGLLQKSDGRYALTLDSATFLDKRSPACIGAIANFLTMSQTIDTFMNLAESLRNNGSSAATKQTVVPESPMWVEFARSMRPLMMMPAGEIANLLEVEKGQKCKVLDVAAGHGTFGIAIAQQNPNADIFALDWANVLAVAKENAQAAGVISRYHLLPGSAFELPLGSNYDVILLTNFLHHFDTATIESFLRKVHAALAPEGRAVTLEFVPNDDRITPRAAAAFSMTMLGQSPAGDAYTFAEYQRMFRNARFSSIELHAIPGPESVIISRK